MSVSELRRREAGVLGRFGELVRYTASVETTLAYVLLNMVLRLTIFTSRSCIKPPGIAT